MPKVFSAQPSGIAVNGERYIFIRNQDTFVILRKGADGMVIFKLNTGREKKAIKHIPCLIILFFLAYIISIGINQKPEMLVGATNKIGEYLKNCNY